MSHSVAEPTGYRTPVLECRQLTAHHGAVQVVYGADLYVSPGERVVIFGRNGAGKTSLVRTLAGLMPATGGSIRSDGADITATSAQARSQNGFATVAGGDAVFRSLSVAENLAMHAFALSGGERRARIEEALASLPPLRQRLRQSAGSLSSGERQMLGLAKAVITRPRLLLVDELSLGLAPVVVRELTWLIGHLCNTRGMALLVVEQSVPVGLELADRVYVMNRGAVTAEFPVGRIRSRPDILQRELLDLPQTDGTHR